MRRGFTLLEVLISISLVGVLLGSMFAFLFDMLSSRARALDETARRRAATTLIERLEADLMTCLVGDSSSGAGIHGDNASMVILSRSVSAHLADRGIDDATVLGDLQVTEYRFDGVSGVIEARRRLPDEPVRGDRGFAPLGHVAKVRFRYRDSGGWRDSFDSLAESRLPVAVEVAVWFRPWPGEEEPEGGGADDETPTRLTFDASGGFDEAEYVSRIDVEMLGEPRPDRFRVIVIPDGATDDPYANDDVEEPRDTEPIES